MTEQKVVDILSKQLRIEKSKITLKTNMTTDLGADSLDLVEILMTLEEEFNISIPDDAISSIITVEDLVKYIDSKKK